MGSPGYVYVLTNESMPGVVKVGKTTRCPWDRAGELWTTGVPTPFRVECAVSTDDVDALEALVHNLLQRDRVSSAREFFRTAPKKASLIVVWASYDEFAERSFIHTDLADMANHLSDRMNNVLEDNLDPMTVRQVASLISAEAIIAAWERRLRHHIRCE